MNYWTRNVVIGLGCLLIAASCQEKKQGRHIQPGLDKNALIEVNKQLTEKDKDIIEAFIKRKQWPMDFYPDGYYGMIMKEGAGATAVDGAVIELNCTVKALDGTVYYTGQIHEFVVGKSVEIAGLHRAAMRLREGAQARFIFPPHLAYGLVGDRNKIGARSILLYEVDVLKLVSH